MAESRPRGAAAPPVADTGRTAAVPGSLFWLNNALSILSNVAWWVAAPFIPLYLAAHGASLALVGVIIGVSGVAPLLISIHAGALADESGPALVAKGSVILFGLAGVILTWMHNLWWLAGAYTLMGIANIGFAVAPQAIVAAASSDPAARTRNYGYYFLWSSGGAVIGPIVGGLVAGRFGYTAAFALMWLLMLPCLWIAACLPGVPARPRPAVSLATAHMFARQIAGQRSVGGILFISFIVVCGQTLKQSFLPIYLHKVGLTATLIGAVFAVDSLSSMGVRSTLSWGVARLGYAPLLLGATFLAAFALGVTPLLRQFWPLAAASALMGASTGFTQPLTMSLLVESVAADFWGVAIGIRQSVQRLASVTSPIVFGAMITLSGIESAFFLGALTLLGSVPIMAGVTRHLHPGRAAAPASLTTAGPDRRARGSGVQCPGKG